MKLQIKNPEKVMGIVKYVLGILGTLAVILAIMTVTNVLSDLLIKFDYSKPFTDTNKLTVSLTSAIVGILFLFIAFSKYIDKFFAWLEKTDVKFKKTGDAKGLNLESTFFFIIGVSMLAFAIMLGIGYLKTEPIPFLGEATDDVLIISLVLLSLAALFTAFNKTVLQSVKEMKKVTWPKYKQMKDYSIKVFSFIIFFSVLFFFLDELMRVLKGVLNL